MRRGCGADRCTAPALRPVCAPPGRQAPAPPRSASPRPPPWPGPASAGPGSQSAGARSRRSAAGPRWRRPSSPRPRPRAPPPTGTPSATPGHLPRGHPGLRRTGQHHHLFATSGSAPRARPRRDHHPAGLRQALLEGAGRSSPFPPAANTGTSRMTASLTSRSPMMSRPHPHCRAASRVSPGLPTRPVTRPVLPA